MIQADEILEKHDVRRTKTRVQVLGTFLSSDAALTQQSIESMLPELDRITLYRTLKTFEKKGIIHHAVDATSRPKYAICSPHCTEHKHLDNHAHFHCEVCGKTTCLQEVNMPKVKLKKGMVVKSAHLVFDGVCDQCN